MIRLCYLAPCSASVVVPRTRKIELTKNEREEQRDSCADTVTGVGTHIIRTKMIIKQWIGMIISKFSLS
jgi:hypothetical protein